MSRISEVNLNHVLALKDEIVKKNFVYAGNKPLHNEHTLEVKLKINEKESVFRLDIKDNKKNILATAMSSCCLPLDAVIIEGSSNAHREELKYLSTQLLRRLQLPIKRLHMPTSRPVDVVGPKANIVEADLYNAVKFLAQELAEKPTQTQKSLKGEECCRLLSFMPRQHKRLFQIAKRLLSAPKTDQKNKQVSTAFLEGIAILSLIANGKDGSWLGPAGETDLSGKWSLVGADMFSNKTRWMKIRGFKQIYMCHIAKHQNAEAFQTNIYFAEVGSVEKFDIKKCIVKTLQEAPRSSKAHTGGGGVTSEKGIVSTRIEDLWTRLHDMNVNVNEYFKICTELLYYVGTIKQTSLPDYKAGDGSVVDVFSLLQRYLFSELCGKTEEPKWLYRFKNMVNMQKTYPSFWGIVPFLEEQI
jgi:hypothetical protein